MLMFGNRKTANIVELVMVQHNLDARRWVINLTPRPLYPVNGSPVLFVQEAGKAQVGQNGCG